MPQLNGREKSTLPRGIKSTRAEYGVCGDWWGIPTPIWHESVEHQTFVLATQEKTHIILVPKWCRDEVFAAMGATWSWSKHLAAKVIVDAVAGGTRPEIWHHGIVTIRTMNGRVIGTEETHTEKPKPVKAPWAGKPDAETKVVSTSRPQVMQTRL